MLKEKSRHEKNIFELEALHFNISKQFLPVNFLSSLTIISSLGNIGLPGIDRLFRFFYGGSMIVMTGESTQMLVAARATPLNYEREINRIEYCSEDNIIVLGFIAFLILIQNAILYSISQSHKYLLNWSGIIRACLYGNYPNVINYFMVMYGQFILCNHVDELHAKYSCVWHKIIWSTNSDYSVRERMKPVWEDPLIKDSGVIYNDITNYFAKIPLSYDILVFS